MADKPPVSDVLAGLLTDLDRHTREIGGFMRLTSEQLTWRPSPLKWSVAHCIDHLIAQNTPYEKPLTLALDRAHPGKNDRPLRMSLAGRLLYNSVDPALIDKRKSRTPPMFRPAPEPDLPTLFDRFHTSQHRLRDRLVRAQEVDAQGVRVSSPAMWLFRFNVATALRILVVHEERHLIQMRKILALPGFP